MKTDTSHYCVITHLLHRFCTLQASGIAVCAGGIYLAKHSIGVAARFVEARLGKPSLVRETSRFTAIGAMKHPIKVIRAGYNN